MYCSFPSNALFYIFIYILIGRYNSSTTNSNITLNEQTEKEKSKQLITKKLFTTDSGILNKDCLNKLMNLEILINSNLDNIDKEVDIDTDDSKYDSDIEYIKSKVLLYCKINSKFQLSKDFEKLKKISPIDHIYETYKEDTRVFRLQFRNNTNSS